MASKFIIECPSCKVQFYVTDELLSAAGGELRCGFCLHVFNGKDCLINKEPVVAELGAIDSSDDKAQKESRRISSLEEYSEDYWTEVVSTFSAFSVADIANNQKDKEVETAQNILKNIDQDILDYIEAIDFDGLFSQDDSTLENTVEEAYQKPIEAVTVSIKDEKSTQLEQVSLLPIEESAEKYQSALMKTSPSTITIEAVDELCGSDLDEESEIVGEQEQIELLEQQYPEFDDGSPKDIYGNHLKVVTTLDFATPKKKVINNHTIAWSFLSLLAVLVLAGQYVRFIAPSLAKDETTRPFGEVACQYLQCKIPVQVDVDKIRTERLSIRVDTEYKSVLNVDSIIYNDAKFSQPYPIIELRFTDLNGQTVANRQFAPDEYLSDEILKQNKMPAKMPVYISFQIIDPGESATGYSLYYYPVPLKH